MSSSNSASKGKSSGHLSKSDSATRGVSMLPYGHPQHFAQRQRPTNSPFALPPIRPRDPSQVIVRFYHCENLNFSKGKLNSPDIDTLLSAASAFLGECHVLNMPETLLPRQPNPGYRGLSLQAAHGYHLYYPDHAGPRPYHKGVSDDWSRVIEDHARDFPNAILLVGVGTGTPSRECSHSAP
ncbi:hypothetical protein NPX13_g4678 [Xylaria arbuscula]|uniref:Uncharacterized protein n=1 Tax=Xylaria arbuscula TaxID=114810 RepID=A0A9W8TND7_9PEZI|nr:hypothetical protein NPX13_g4678 [Xylaria arbuscula]